MCHGSSGAVFAVSSEIVVKTACRYDNLRPGYAEEEHYIRRCIREQRAIFDIFAEPENWHPSIVLSFLHSPGTCFMERTPTDESDHVTDALCASSRTATCTVRMLKLIALHYLRDPGQSTFPASQALKPSPRPAMISKAMMIGIKAKVCYEITLVPRVDRSAPYSSLGGPTSRCMLHVAGRYVSLPA